MKEHPIIGIVNMQHMPAPQLRKIRQQLRGTALIRMTKKRLMVRAMEEAKRDKQGVDELGKHLKGLPAFIFTKENPFKLYKLLQASKSTAPAKPGQTAPNSIKVSAGPTSFPPGPIISELGRVGIKAGIEGGKVTIKQDTVVTEEGDVITDALANILTKLGIEPMEIGLDLVMVYENGSLFEKKVLAIDEKEYLANIRQAHAWAFNLAMEAAFPTKETTARMIQRVFRESKAVALEANIMADAVAKELLAKAERQMLALKSKLPEAPAEKKEGEQAESQEAGAEGAEKKEAPKEGTKGKKD